MKVVVAAFNQEKALVGAFSVITNLRMELFQTLFVIVMLPSSALGEEVAGDKNILHLNDINFVSYVN